MDETQYIIGLMKQNTDALGFIPASTIENRYVGNGQYLVQKSLTGQTVGYLLHGVLLPGRSLSIAQAVIDFDKRNRGHGEDMIKRFIDRARSASARTITLRCADDLQANEFWLACGFERTNQLCPVNRRKRLINVYVFDLYPTLFCK